MEAAPKAALNKRVMLACARSRSGALHRQDWRGRQTANRRTIDGEEDFAVWISPIESARRIGGNDIAHLAEAGRSREDDATTLWIVRFTNLSTRSCLIMHRAARNLVLLWKSCPDLIQAKHVAGQQEQVKDQNRHDVGEQSEENERNVRRDGKTSQATHSVHREGQKGQARGKPSNEIDARHRVRLTPCEAEAGPARLPGSPPRCSTPIHSLRKRRPRSAKQRAGQELFVSASSLGGLNDLSSLLQEPRSGLDRKRRAETDRDNLLSTGHRRSPGGPWQTIGGAEPHGGSRQKLSCTAA
jgi:hypothetical protein